MARNATQQSREAPTPPREPAQPPTHLELAHRGKAAVVAGRAEVLDGPPHERLEASLRIEQRAGQHGMLQLVPGHGGQGTHARVQGDVRVHRDVTKLIANLAGWYQAQRCRSVSERAAMHVHDADAGVHLSAHRGRLGSRGLRGRRIGTATSAGAGMGAATCPCASACVATRSSLARLDLAFSLHEERGNGAKPADQQQRDGVSGKQASGWRSRTHAHTHKSAIIDARTTPRQ